jgi:flagellar assembly protein FliH
VHSNGDDPISPEDWKLRIAQARGEGIQEGLQQAQAKLAADLAEARAKLAESGRAFERQFRGYFSKVEVELVHLSLAIAAKILHREAQVDRMLVAALVRVALERLSQGTTATVRVHPQLVAEWSKYFKENAEGELHIEVKGDPAVELHNCLLETELGDTQLGLDAQLKEVEQGFFDLLAQRPDAP